MRMQNPKDDNIVDVADGCIDTMKHRGWVVLEDKKEPEQKEFGSKKKAKKQLKTKDKED